MAVHFTPEQEAHLSEVALEDDKRFRSAVQRGIAQADRREFIEEEEMDERFRRMFES